MNYHAQFLLRYGYLLLFGWVFAEQLGMPVPSIPIILAAGALVALGRFHPLPALLLPVLASVIADTVWYQLGRRKGSRVLHFLCRISIEPDSCVRNTENIFARRGARSLVIAKFVPGLSTAAPPLAGVFHMKLRRFLALDLAGIVLWVGAYFTLGYVFSNQLEDVAAYALRLGTGLLILLILILGGWFAWKFIRRHRFIARLRVDRMTPEELKHRIDSGEEIVIVDLRGSLDFEAEPEMIPGAVHLESHELEEVKDELAKAPEVVLYCT